MSTAPTLVIGYVLFPCYLYVLVQRIWKQTSSVYAITGVILNTPCVLSVKNAFTVNLAVN